MSNEGHPHQMMMVMCVQFDTKLSAFVLQHGLRKSLYLQMITLPEHLLLNGLNYVHTTFSLQIVFWLYCILPPFRQVKHQIIMAIV
jgi:hypothetical protein